MTSTDSTDLTAAIAERAERVRQQIADAAHRSGRDAADVTLVAVTKTRPLATVHAAVAAGLRDLGENRVQELSEKAEALPGEHAGGDVRWHLIGSLQRNKSRDAAAYSDLFHALDSGRLARALDKKAADADRVLPVLVQVNISGEEAKHGVEPEATLDLLAAVSDLEHLTPVGLMGMAQIARDEADLERIVRPAFRRLRQLFDRAPQPLSVLSMGMSGDFEVAIEEGSTHVRVGTALFGPRP
ncbi:MAG: YggS family pyridoxal phosphate-dependent enzyme [Bacteroidota bacterium]